jgi:SNF2 family DNA or RNA helicase
MTIGEQDFDTLLETRMQRFHFLLDYAHFDFKQYQYDGVKWCIANELRPKPPANIRGGFIADEMGLGKTLTMIGTMFAHFVPRTLIVVPSVLIQQWFNEIYRATGHRALLFYGNNKKYITQEMLNNRPIIITTYGSVLPHDCLLKKIVWSRIIFDEAHHLRNKNSRFKACLELKSRIRWLVSGTPVQNKKRDFYNLCEAVGIKSLLYKKTDAMRIIGKNFVLRRTKAQVGIHLPPINISNYVVPWNNMDEMLLSEEIHSLLPNQTNVSPFKRRKVAAAFTKGGALTALLRSRQSCIMSSLMRKNIDTFYAEGLIDQSSISALEYSSKLDAVINLALSRKDNGKGKLIFCHFREEIDEIVRRLVKGGMHHVAFYDGRNSKSSELEALFEGNDALVMQIQTGCEGLNLQQQYSEIYFVSPHWNPFIEEQAIARCHRIGQASPVDVFRFEMGGFSNASVPVTGNSPSSLEKYIKQIQNVKKDISNTLLPPLGKVEPNIAYQGTNDTP